MCGRYAMSFRPSVARRRLQEENMQVDDAPDDDEGSTRQTYNFAPGSHGLVYRAEVPDSGAATEQQDATDLKAQSTCTVDGASTQETRYKLQAMKWGLIPFWTKRAPDYSSQLKTINCRDDSLAQTGGMWNTMKQKKRCIIIAEGFYEWLKKNNGRDKIPHFVKRKDGQLMCFAGLWDCVKYEGHNEKLYTYTIITTSSNKQLSFLHDRMPVILDNGSDQMKTWLDPARSSWSKELQSLLIPYQGELECYPVDKAVGRVGNNSPSFVVPVDSKENKKNIANFFQKQKDHAKGPTEETMIEQKEHHVKSEGAAIKVEPDEPRATELDAVRTEDNAPMPKSRSESSEKFARGVKREFPDSPKLGNVYSSSPNKAQKTIVDHGDDEEEERPHLKSPERSLAAERKQRSAVSNGSAAKAPSRTAADGSRKITAFFAK